MCSCTPKRLFLIRFVVVSMCKFYGWICLQIVNRRMVYQKSISAG